VLAGVMIVVVVVGWVGGLSSLWRGRVVGRWDAMGGWGVCEYDIMLVQGLCMVGSPRRFEATKRDEVWRKS
jgi:hypothetical protein